MLLERSIFDEPHYQSLEIIAAQALADRKEGRAAFLLADRRCRILPFPEPHCYVLRAEALYRLGDKTAALADLARAIEIAPDDLAANRRMLAWAKGPQRLRAARAIVENDSHMPTLRDAIDVLAKNGQRQFAKLTILEDEIEGWAAWRGEPYLQFSIIDGSSQISETFEADPFHPLAQYGNAADFRVRRPKSKHPQLVILATADGPFASTRTAANAGGTKTPVIRPRSKTATDQVTVIVPIYAGYQTTRLCIDGLLTELRRSHHKAIVVNDAAPDVRIARYLTKIAANSSIELIVNERNLGFVGSVNTALNCVKHGDILVLNSDTIVPPRFIERLAAVAHSSPDIGTVTPLSNNGEYVSFPIPNTCNPLGPPSEVAHLDAIAAKVNSGKVVDIPSGIGFCLYITRACCDRVGYFADDFARGYLEDAEFCLRAREQGFRNVCAPSVYVGHAGSRSFGSEKRSLVVRNLRLIEQRFPNHRADCAAFVEADPLRNARAAIELAEPLATHSSLLVTGSGALAATAHQRALQLGAAGKSTIVMEVGNCPNGKVVALKNPHGGVPQSLQFKLYAPTDIKSLAGFLKRQKIARIEFVDPANAPSQLVDLLLNLNVPYDMYVADAGLLAGSERMSASAVETLTTPQRQSLNATQPERAIEQDISLNQWRQIANRAERLIVPCIAAQVLVRRLASNQALRNIKRDYAAGSRRTLKRPARHPARHLGLMPIRSCPREQWLMIAIARQLKRVKPELSITVVGATIDDLGFMRSTGAFVTGSVSSDDFKHLVDTLDVDSLFISAIRPVFAHPMLSVARSSLIPLAYFDWAAGKVKANKHDLAIDPRLPLDRVVARLTDWLWSPRLSARLTPTQ